jgi:hypothetical protein
VLRTRGRAPLIASALIGSLAILPGCGSDSNEGPAAAAGGQTTAPAPASPQDATRRAELRTVLVENTRKKTDGTRNRWFVKAISVTGTDVKVQTQAYPKYKNRTIGRSICREILRTTAWPRTVTVVGANGGKMSEWNANLAKRDCKVPKLPDPDNLRKSS